jgi:4-hydroxy-tetrahydrodipicolinate reductase
MRIAVTGATGQMGSNVIEEARKRGLEVPVAVDRQETVEKNPDIQSDKKLEDLIEEHNVDAIIDFTTPEASLNYLHVASDTDKPIVIGTTGFNDRQKEALDEASDDVPVLKASNFSPAVNVLMELAQEASGKLEDYDIEITETHHNRKKDAPSGTAKKMLERVKETRKNTETVHGREGNSKRQESEIGVHARRAGDIRGSHELLLAGNNEVLKISHRSESRKVFASGALDAAEWIKDRDPGMYEFEEVIG